MKNFLYILYFLSFSVFSQKSTQMIVEYRFFNTEAQSVLNATLFVSGSSTIYLPKYSTKNKKSSNTKNQQTTTYPDLDYLKIDHEKKEILFFDAIVSTDFLIKDNYTKVVWEISDVSKEIAGYNCIKATTSYRGRDWAVWFAPEIPVSYGPWKLHGLPGLIVEASESSGVYSWKIENVEYKRSEIFDKDFSSLVKTKNKVALSFIKFLENQKEYFANVQAQYDQQNNGESLEFPVPPRKLELKYEWEE